MMMVVGLGANLGQPAKTFSLAMSALSPTAEVVAVSPLYRSPAHGYRNQPDFINAAVALRTSLSPAEMLSRLASVERRLGRRRRQRWGPRVIDLDLLWAEDVASNRVDLTIPHPRLLDRRFALQPLLDVVPDARDPASGRPYTRWLGALRGQPLYRVTPMTD